MEYKMILFSLLCALLGVFVLSVIVLKIYVTVTRGKCRSSRQLKGKTVIITGATRGIGKQVALDLAERKARVVMACLDLEEGQKIAGEISHITGNSQNVIAKKCDLSSLQSVRDFANDILVNEERLDVLINNAAMVPKAGRHLTDEGFEIQFVTNYLGHFLLTNLLLDLLKLSSPSRIVVVSSIVHRIAKLDFKNLNLEERTIIPYLNYSNTKLELLLFSRELSRRLRGTGVTVNAVHPGAVRTQINRHAGWYVRYVWEPFIYAFSKTPKEGAETIIHAAVSEELEQTSGKYFVDCKEATVSEQAASDEVAGHLWRVSEDYCKLNLIECVR